MRNKKVMIFAILMMALLPTVALATTLTTNEIIFGAEDDPIFGDKDNNDLVFRVSGVNLRLNSSTPVGGWQNLAGYVIDNNGNPYMDNASGDGLNKNILHLVTGTGGFTGNPAAFNIPQQFLQFWGTNTGAAAPYYISVNGDISTTLRIEVAAWAGTNALSYVGLVDNIEHSIFAGTASAGATATFTPGQDFVWVEHTNAGTFRSDVNGAAFAPIQETPELGTWAMVLSALALFGRKNFIRQLIPMKS